MSDYIERIENLIRVVAAVPDDRFDLKGWYDPRTQCGCAIGHAMNDPYFIARRFYVPCVSLVDWCGIAAFFGISIERARLLFARRVGYETRHAVLAALRVLLLEKMAQQLPAQFESKQDFEIA